MSESITDELLTILNIAVLELIEDGVFKVIGQIPDWFSQFEPDIASKRDELTLENFHFIANFLIDAENFWNSSEAEPLSSGIWIETDVSGNEYQFEATAVRLRERKILLIDLLKFAYQDKQLLIQKGRENRLIYERLVKEIQKKEILLHCIVHDLAGQISAVANSLELLNSQNLTLPARKFLEIGKSQAMQQAMLIREILNAFSADMEAIETFIFDPNLAPDLATAVKEIVEAFRPSFAISNINLRLGSNIDSLEESKVVGEKLHLDRVLFNLVENAFRHSPAHTTVTVDVSDEGEFLLLTVEDEGTGVSPDIANKLFEKFVQGKGKTGRAGLGLYFCRITVESWGGTIGYTLRESGGSRFWVRLRKAVGDGARR
ncbi:MAG TPA: ATPase [Cyanobacteria bacterium UBA11372]|nr:ATPase [Cyanobacteria bacterium UBA11372]